MTTAFAPLLAQLQETDSPNDIWQGWGSLILVIGVLSLVTIIICLVIWQVFKTAQSRMAAQAISGHDTAYRQLVEDATTAQRQAARDLATLKEDMADVRGRVTTIETLLREVG